MSAESQKINELLDEYVESQTSSLGDISWTFEFRLVKAFRKALEDIQGCIESPENHVSEMEILEILKGQ